MRNWFITGVSSGLGRALAIAALAAGDRVAGTIRSAEAVAKFEALADGRAYGFVLDVTDQEAVPRVIAAADAALGGIDVLVNNAGYSYLATIEEASVAEIRDQFEANFFGPIAIIKAALPFMRPRRRGHIVNVSSMAAHGTRSAVGYYGGTKSALESVSAALADELAPFGLHVTVVIPGAFRTDLGHSRRAATHRVAEYDALNAERQQFLKVFSTTQRGDPRKGAEAIIAAVASTTPPQRLLIGVDAVDGVRADLNSFEAEIAAWETVSSATDLEE